MSTFINCPRMSQEEWLLWRRNGIGSSDAPVIMNGSHFGDNLLKKWEEKVLGKVKADNIYMKHGRDNEEPARRAFESLLNTSVFPVNVESSSTGWMRASLDGIDVNGKVLVEIKCPKNKDDHLAGVNKKVPEKYIAQCQHQLAVTGLPGMYYFSFYNDEGAVVEVVRDDKYIEELFSKEKEFWDMVLSKEPPVVYLDMAGNLEWKKSATQLLKLREKKKALEDQEEIVIVSLKSLSQGQSARGYGIEMQKQKVKGAVDYSKIPQLQGVDLEAYRKNHFFKYPIRVIQ